MTSTTTAGFTLEPVFTAPGAHGFDGVEFTLRDALIQSGSGKTVFEQKDCEVPTSWSQTATNIVASKYFHGALGTPGTRTQREAAHHTGCRHNHRGGISAGYFDG
jgi:ribonucleoside-diphosphate reductase alpha chain